jgi:hypothetical protein
MSPTRWHRYIAAERAGEITARLRLDVQTAVSVTPKRLAVATTISSSEGKARARFNSGISMCMARRPSTRVLNSSFPRIGLSFAFL